MDKDIENSAKMLYEFLKNNSDFVATGIGDGIIYVYVKRKKYFKNTPDTFDGFPVEIKVVGNIKAIHNEE